MSDPYDLAGLPPIGGVVKSNTLGAGLDDMIDVTNIMQFAEHLILSHSQGFEKEEQRAKELFRANDADGSGKLEKPELELLLASLEIGLEDTNVTTFTCSNACGHRL